MCVLCVGQLVAHAAVRTCSVAAVPLCQPVARWLGRKLAEDEVTVGSCVRGARAPGWARGDELNELTN